MGQRSDGSPAMGFKRDLSKGSWAEFYKVRVRGQLPYTKRGSGPYSTRLQTAAISAALGQVGGSAFEPVSALSHTTLKSLREQESCSQPFVGKVLCLVLGREWLKGSLEIISNTSEESFFLSIRQSKNLV